MRKGRAGGGRKLHRRAFLRHAARGAAGLGGTLLAARALAQDVTLQTLIEQTQRNDFGQDFDSGLRSVVMPKRLAADALAADSADHRAGDPAL